MSYLTEVDAKYIDERTTHTIPVIETKEINVSSSGLMTPNFSISITVSNNYTFIDLFNYVIELYPNCGDSSFYIYDTKIFISIENATHKIMDYADKNIHFIQYGIFKPKNDLTKIKNILGIHKNNLQNTINLYDTDIINLAKLGTWYGFGAGATQVPDEENNFICNLIFIRYKNLNGDDYQTFAYNRYALLKNMDANKLFLLIPHLNIKINAKEFLKTLNSILLENKSNFTIITIDDFII